MQLRQHEQELGELNSKVIVVTFQAGPLVEMYVKQSALTWPILVDQTLSLYRAYDMGRADWWQLWSPSTLWLYAKLLARGRKLQRSAADVSQLGGDVLVDPNGIVRLHHVGQTPADRPSVDTILRTIRKIE